MHIRQLKETDAQAYKDLRLEALRESPESFGSSLQDEAAQSLDWFQDRLSKNSIFGAFEGDHLCGLAGFYQQGGVKLKHKGVLWGLYVQPSARGLGAGQGLIQAVLEHAKDRVQKVKLTVAAHNEAAKNLYEQCGFKTYGHEKDALRIGNETHDELLMEREV